MTHLKNFIQFKLMWFNLDLLLNINLNYCYISFLLDIFYFRVQLQTKGKLWQTFWL